VYDSKRLALRIEETIYEEEEDRVRGLIVAI